MHDITKLSDDFIQRIGRVDVITGGFPCQAFSLAGKRKGFSDTRGTLFLKLHASQKFCDLAIYSLKTSRDFSITREGLRLRRSSEPWMSWGMTWHGKCLTAKDFVPQNRERVFIIGHFRGSGARKFLPLTGEEESADQESAKINLAGTTRKKNDLSTNLRERTYFTNGLMGTLTATDYKMPKQIVVGNVNPSGNGMNGQVCSSEGVAPTLTTNNGEGNKIAIPILSPDKDTVRQNGHRIKNDGEEMFTLTVQDRHGIIVEGKIDGRYRSATSVYSTKGISPTLNTMQGGGQQPKIIVNEATKQGYTPAVPGERFNFEIRKLTPLECWRLQAFSDWAFLAAKFGSREIAKDILENQKDHYSCDHEVKVSNSQLYKQAGNSVTVSVIYFIAKHLSINL